MMIYFPERKMQCLQAHTGWGETNLLPVGPEVGSRLLFNIMSLLCRMPDSVTHPERVVIAQAEASSMDAESLLVVP
jgi:hypothetical protein